MHKKLEAELIHLAHQILKLNKNTNIKELQEKAREIYENLSVLSFVDEYFVETPEVTDDKTDFLAKFRETVAKDVSSKSNISLKEKKTPEAKTEISKLKVEKKEPIVEKVAPIVEKAEPVVEKTEPIIKKSEKEETDQLVKQTISTIKSEAKEIVNKIQTPQPKVTKKSAFEEEMKDSISADVAANMFERLEKSNITESNPLFASSKSEIELDDALKQPEIKESNPLFASSKSEVELDDAPKQPEIKESNPLFASSKSEVELDDAPKQPEIKKSNPLFASTKSERVFEEEPAKNQEPVKAKVNIATKQDIPKAKTEIGSSSLNDRIASGKIQVGLNDRIAFVKHLFNFSQEDFNSVLSQLNSFTSEQESLNYIQNEVKLKHDWTNKEEYEERLLTLIERKFK